MAVLLSSDAVLVYVACYIILDQRQGHDIRVVFLLHVDICVRPLAAPPLLCAQPLLALSECHWDEFVKQGCIAASCPPKPSFKLNLFAFKPTKPRYREWNGAQGLAETEHSLILFRVKTVPLPPTEK